MPRRSQHRITKRCVDALRAREKDYVIWDRDLPGFGVRVGPSGRKTFVVQARGPCGSKRASIGRHGDVTVAEARKRAAGCIGRIKRGADSVPAGSRREPTVAELAGRYMRFHVAVNTGPSTAELYRGVIDNHILPALGERKIGAVRRNDVADLQYALHDRPGAANITLQVLSQMFCKAEQWGLLPERTSPCRPVSKFPLRRRERFLNRDEYRRLGRVLKEAEAAGSMCQIAIAALRVLLLSGCRRDEVLTLRWDDVDFHARELRLRGSKTRRNMVVLTSAVESVLKGVPRMPGNPWVFPGKRPGRRLMTLKSVWREAAARAGLGGVRLHDLRHSYASRALAVGESLSMIGKLLNHAQVQSTARYSHLAAEAEKAAAARVGNAIARHIGVVDGGGG